MALEPRYLSMVIPSRWLAGGRGLGDFREKMLTEGHIREFVDYTKMSTAFPGVDFEGGVGYFLWDNNYDGLCQYKLVLGDEELPSIQRKLDDHDIFVRDNRALGGVDKFEPVSGGGDVDHGQEALRELVIACRDGAINFEASEEALDLVALFMEFPVVFDLHTAI